MEFQPVPLSTTPPKRKFSMILKLGIVGGSLLVVLVLAVIAVLLSRNTPTQFPIINPTPVPIQTPVSSPVSYTTPTTPVVIPPVSEPVTDPTSSWNIYTNEEIGLSVKHPADWPVKFVPPAAGAGYAGASVANLQVGEIINIYRGQAMTDKLKDLNSGLLQTVNDPVEMPGVRIAGVDYTFTKALYGDGVPGSSPDCVVGGSVASYYFIVNGELVTVTKTTTSSCDADGKQVTVKTKDTDMQTARAILSTLTYSSTN